MFCCFVGFPSLPIRDGILQPNPENGENVQQTSLANIDLEPVVDFKIRFDENTGSALTIDVVAAF
ncbi:hypothetical protein QUF90_24125 [Desulfococcaceae bacterium HSG9]|nr:hypothetical protein [Desulfococcaceae bacterium HSG9]